MRSLIKFGAWLLFVSGISQASLFVPADSVHAALQTASQIFPVAPPISSPNGLRPCCAFGYDLKTGVLGVTVPFYRINNVAEADDLGQQHYNNRLLGAVSNILGMSSEHSGVVYTTRGGFIDIAHVRDTADMTFYIFSHLWQQLGQEIEIDTGEELAQRRIKLFAFTPPADPAKRYELAAALSAYLAFQIAAWHEIAQWYGYQSIPGFSEELSGFSPEDLYSNLLGAELGLTLIQKNQVSSVARYNLAMPVVLQQALHQLGAVSADQTREQFNQLDGQWWDSQRHLPEKFLVLNRNYETGDSRFPTPVPGETASPVALMLSHDVAGYTLSSLAELQLWPGKNMAQLPKPERFYTFRDFPLLARYAQQQDATELMKLHP